MVDLQSTNRTKLSKVRESTFGVTPSNPPFKEVRNTSSSLNANPQTVTSNEIRQDRQVSDLILVGQQAGGDVAGELSFHAYDDEFEEALQGTWETQPYIECLTADTEISDVSTTTITVAAGGTAFKAGMLTLTQDFGVAANNKLARVSSSSGTTIVYPSATYTAESSVPKGANVRVVGFEGASGDIAAVTSGGNALTSSSLDFTTLGIKAGDWLLIGSAVTDTSFASKPANNGWVRVGATPTANRIDLDIVPSGWDADAGTSKTIRVFHGDRLRNGSTKRSNTFERQYLDHSPVTYEYFRGMTLNTLTLTLPTKAVVTVTKGYIGRDGVMPYPMARISGATDTEAPTNDVMNSSSDIAELSIDGVAITGPNFVMAATLSINNNLRAQDAIGEPGSVGTGNGEFSAALSQFQTYFGSPDIARKVNNNTPFGFAARIVAPNSNDETYVLDLPRCKFQTGAPGIGGKNADVMLDGSVQATRHPTLGYTMGINRLWYTP